MQVNVKGQKKTDPCAVSLINLLVWYKCQKLQVSIVSFKVSHFGFYTLGSPPFLQLGVYTSDAVPLSLLEASLELLLCDAIHQLDLNSLQVPDLARNDVGW